MMALDPDKLKYQMTVNYMGNKELAEATGLSLTTVSHLRTGRITSPKPDTMRRLCEALHCTPQDLIYRPE